MDFFLFLLFVVSFPLGLLNFFDVRLSSAYCFNGKWVGCSSPASSISLESSPLNAMDAQSSQQQVCCDDAYTLQFSLALELCKDSLGDTKCHDGY